MKPTRALVTGASSGIGEEFAKILASQGVNLVIAARREDRLLALKETLVKSYGISVEIVPIDLTSPHSAEDLFKLSTKSGPIDMLINNAGAGPYRAFLKTSRLEHEKIMQLNMVSLTSLSHLFAEHMKKHGRPSWILNVASIAAFSPAPRFAVYCGSKYYVRIFSEILRHELKATNISVSCLCPGGTATEFSKVNNQEVSSGMFLMSAEKVARIGLEGAFKKKTVIIPGFFNKLSCLLSSILPDSIAIPLSEKAMDMAVKEQTH